MTGWRYWRGPEAERLLDAAERSALATVAQRVLDQAKTEVPRDHGDLARSGRLRKGRYLQRRAAIRVEIVFGGKRAPYAVRWHWQDARFKKGRKNHYLLDPYNQIVPRDLPSELRREARERLR